jgi:energy-coupling factor transporter transmembrane protein EcfT
VRILVIFILTYTAAFTGLYYYKKINFSVPHIMAIFLLFILVALCIAIFLEVGSREKGLPPGPPTVPILGNAHIFPTEFAHYK